MSRIGKQPILIPEGVTVSREGNIISVKGPKGTLSRTFVDSVTIETKGSEITLAPRRTDKATRSLWGTYAAHLKNMIKGVQTPYQKVLLVEGVGFKWEVKGKDLALNLGFSHPVTLSIPEGITVVAEKGTLTVSGIDKDAVGLFANRVRSLKKPEPYKGKGIRYQGEVILRKQGKKAA